MTLFDGAWARLDRASDHRHDLARGWNAFVKEEPYEFSVDVHESGQAALWVYEIQRPPAQLGVYVGEWLYNLRSAMDYAVFDLAVHDSGQDPPPGAGDLSFPLCRSSEQFTGYKKKLRALSNEHLGRIEEVQPYQGGHGAEGHPLWWLHELARLDRHRRLSRVCGFVAESNPVIHAPNATGIFVEDFNSRVYVDGHVQIGRFRVEPYEWPDKVEVNPQTAIDMEIHGFPGGGPAREFPINERLRLIEAFVRTLIASMEKDATGRDRLAERRRSDVTSGG